MTITLWCPCARLHVHIERPLYMSREAAIEFADRIGVLVPCPFCGEKPAVVPASSEVAAK